MPEQKNSSFLIIFLLVVVCVLGGIVAYYFLRQPSDSQIPPGTAAPSYPQSSNTEFQATASFDQSSLTSHSATPTITGTYSKLTGHGLEIVVAKGSLPQTALLIDPIQGQVWSDRSDHGGGIVLDGADTGAFKNNVQTSLPNGSYTVGVYSVTLYYPQTPENIARDFRTLLVQGTLVIDTPY